MAHMEPLSTEEALAAAPELQEHSERFDKQFGFIPNSLRTMARSPKLVKGFLGLQKSVMASEGSTISQELKHLVSHIASKASGCMYCQAHTSYVSGRVGIAQERVEKLWEYQTSDLFTEAERAALDFALAAASVPNAVTEEIFARLRDHWDETQIVEILGVVAFFGFLNRWNDAMATTLEDPANHFADDLFGEKGWNVGKHS